MSRSLRYLAFALVSAIWLATTVRGSDQVPAQIAPDDDSIGAVKRDLQELKSNATSGAALPQSTSPLVGMPQFHAVEEPVIVAKPQKADGNATQQQASANWLLDAMTKSKSDRTTDRRRDTLDPRSRREDDLLGRHPTNGERQAVDQAESTSDEQPQRTRRPNEPFNPLDHFMADWLTPQDYAMLKKTNALAADRNGDTGSPSPLPTAVPANGDLGTAFAGLGLEELAADKEAAAFAKAPIENPYLQAFAVPEAPPQPTQSTPAMTSPVAPSFLPPPAPEPATTKPTLPDFVKPAIDDKYFKPLKRF